MFKLTKTQFRDSPHIFYMSRSKDQRACYYIPVDKIVQRFGSARQQNMWLSKFKDRKQQQGESVSALENE